MNRNRSKLIKSARATAAVVTLLLLAVTLNSCNKELTNGELPSPGGESVEIQITFPKSQQPQVAHSAVKSGVSAKAKASDDAGLTFWTSGTQEVATRATDPGTEQERQIDRMAILIFNDNGTKLEDVLTVDLSSSNASLPNEQPVWKSKNTLVIRPITDKTTPKKIYAVANWSKTDFDKQTYTEAMLKKEFSMANTGSQQIPFLMCGSSSVNFSTSDYRVTIELERQVAKLKVDLTVDKATQEALSYIEWLFDEAQLAFGNFPDKSYVVGRTPAAIPAGHTLLVSKFQQMTNVSVSGDLKCSENLYVYENPVTGNTDTDKEKTNYIVIRLPYRNKITEVKEQDNYYKVYLNNKGNANPYQVLRNTVYNFNLKVIGLGLPFTDLIADTNIEDDLTVNVWEEYDIKADNKPKYFNVSSNFIGFQFKEIVHKAIVSTDVSDWKLTKTDGTTLFSFAENKTDPFTDANLTYTIGGTASSATITITKNSTETFAQQKMTLVARNIRVPFTVAYDNGIIPNSVLEAAGWTASAADRPTGLQVAKRGSVLPSGMALLDDPTVQWSTEYVDTKAKAAGYGFGKSNTAELLKLGDADKYPAVNLCKALGEEWYLPSKNELVLISTNQSLPGTSYSFYDNIYWSSTQADATDAWFVYSDDGHTDGYQKTNINRVRCVKNI